MLMFFSLHRQNLGTLQIFQYRVYDSVTYKDSAFCRAQHNHLFPSQVPNKNQEAHGPQNPPELQYIIVSPAFWPGMMINAR